MPKYSYEVAGRSAEGQHWKVSGDINTDKPGDFAYLPAKVLATAFQRITKGEAVYGLPGVACNGPYSIDRLLIIREEDLP
jgi:hypothetical protein